MIEKQKIMFCNIPTKSERAEMFYYQLLCVYLPKHIISSDIE